MAICDVRIIAVPKAVTKTCFTWNNYVDETPAKETPLSCSIRTTTTQSRQTKRRCSCQDTRASTVVTSLLDLAQNMQAATEQQTLSDRNSTKNVTSFNSLTGGFSGPLGATGTCSLKRPGRSCFLSRGRKERWCASSVSSRGGS